MAADGRGHVVGEDAGKLRAVNDPSEFLGKMGDAGGCGQAVGRDILGSIVMRV